MMNRSSLPHVVIIGGGFGGLQTARRLKRAQCQVTLVDRRNHHIFQPLLYQVATGGLSAANIAQPLRRILSKQSNCETLMAEAVDFDIENKKVLLADGELDYDYLVVAAGAVSSYFGNDHFEEHAPGLKSIEDAEIIRTKTYVAFEAAERETDDKAREQWLNFVIVGGGPTGVELAGAISEIANQTLKHDFRRINPSDAKVILVEAGPRILGPFSESISQKAQNALEKMGVDVRTSTMVVDVAEDHVQLKQGDEVITVPTRTIVWGAGVQANKLGCKLAKACGVEPARGGRIPVTSRLNVQGHEQIFAIGDITSCMNQDGKPLPGLAATAMQQGDYLAKQIDAHLRGNPSTQDFQYVDKGSMATIGLKSAVAQFGKKEYDGFFAWLMWMTVHLFLLVQFQTRVLVFLQWTWNYFTMHRTSRLILGIKRVALPGHKAHRADGEKEKQDTEKSG